MAFRGAGSSRELGISHPATGYETFSVGYLLGLSRRTMLATGRS